MPKNNYCYDVHFEGASSPFPDFKAGYYHIIKQRVKKFNRTSYVYDAEFEILKDMDETITVNQTIESNFLRSLGKKKLAFFSNTNFIEVTGRHLSQRHGK